MILDMGLSKEMIPQNIQWDFTHGLIAYDGIKLRYSFIFGQSHTYRFDQFLNVLDFGQNCHAVPVPWWKTKLCAKLGGCGQRL